MGQSKSVVRAPDPRPAVAAGKTRICVAGFALSHHTDRAGKLARTIVKSNPGAYESWFYFDSKGFRGKDRFTGATDGNPEAGGFLATIKAELSPEQREQWAGHMTSPFCWLELPRGEKQVLGGRDGLSAWATAEPALAAQAAVQKMIGEPSSLEAWVDTTPGTANVGGAAAPPMPPPVPQ